MANIIKKKNSLSLIIIGLTGTLPNLALACTAAQKANGCVELLSVDGTIGSILSNIKDWLLGFSAAIAILFIIIGGYQYIVSSGNEKQVASAKATLTWAIIGLVVILLAQVIINLVARSVSGILTI